MTEHKKKPHPKPADIRSYIKADLKMHGKQSLHQISIRTGFHFNTVRTYVKRLIDAGEIVRVQKEEYEYALPKGENSA
jgi:lambda repressor-like predicted transcriptional regulator